jgi:tetratricopeptide (TPR) repeat protein
LAKGVLRPLSYNPTQYKAPAHEAIPAHFSKGFMKQVRSYVTQSLRAMTLAATLVAPIAYADEYADVSQMVRAGKLAEALVKADQYLVAKPRDPQMRFLKGVIQRDSGKTAEAITTFTRLTEDFPELPEPYNNLAVLYAGQSQFDKARTALEMAIRTNPSYSTAHENLGDVYAKLASQAYSKALQLDNDNQAVPPKLALIRELFMAQGGKTAKTGTVPAAVATAPAVVAKPATAAPAPAPAPAPFQPAVTPPTKPAAPVIATAPAAVVPAPAPAAKPVDTGGSNQEVESMIKAWASAWSSKDIKGYLGAYGKEFNPPGSQSRAAWEQERRTKITSKSKIDVKIENLAVSVNGDKAVARFRQDYRAGALAVSSRKTLDLVKKGERWHIVKETIGG